MPERLLLGDATPPGWKRWALPAAVAWALSYGSLRAYWAVTGAPSPPPADTDLVGFTWWALCAAAAVTVVAIGKSAWSLSLTVAAWGVAIALAVASALLLLDSREPAARIQAVIVFGSVARGEAHADSDIDQRRRTPS